MGDRGQARHFAELALAQEEPLAAPYALYTLALIAQAQDDPSQARRLLQRCIAAGERNDDHFIQAHAWLKLAQLLPPEDETLGEAAGHAARLFGQLGIAGLAEEAWAMM